MEKLNQFFSSKGGCAVALLGLLILADLAKKGGFENFGWGAILLSVFCLGKLFLGR